MGSNIRAGTSPGKPPLWPAAAACRPQRPDAAAAAAAMPALVLTARVPCDTTARRVCPPPTRFTVLLVNPQGFTAPESLQVSLEPQRAGDVAPWDERVRRGRF